MTNEDAFNKVGQIVENGGGNEFLTADLVRLAREHMHEVRQESQHRKEILDDVREALMHGEYRVALYLIDANLTISDCERIWNMSPYREGYNFAWGIFDD